MDFSSFGALDKVLLMQHCELRRRKKSAQSLLTSWLATQAIVEADTDGNGASTLKPSVSICG